MNHALSIVVPVFNSTSSLNEICDKVFNTLSNYEVELILVDDGSSEDTWEEIKEIKKRFVDNLKAIRLSKNFGQHNATLCGINHCSYPTVVTIDDDMQFSPEDIPKLLEIFNRSELDLVYGMPKKKMQNFIRRSGQFFLIMIGAIFNEKLMKSSSFRIMKKSLAERLKANERYYINLDILLHFYTSRISYCAVPHRNRLINKSGYSTMGLVRIASRSLIAYSAVPYKLFLIIFLFSLFVFILFFMFYFLAHPVFIQSIPLLLVISVPLFTLSSIFLFAYLFHITSFISNKPCYHINDII